MFRFNFVLLLVLSLVAIHGATGNDSAELTNDLSRNAIRGLKGSKSTKASSKGKGGKSSKSPSSKGKGKGKGKGNGTGTGTGTGHSTTVSSTPRPTPSPTSSPKVSAFCNGIQIFADGICDLANNNAACQFDAEDCAIYNRADKLAQECVKKAIPKNAPQTFPANETDRLGDKVCDQKYNNNKCNFDFGDCGARRNLRY